MYQKQCLSHNDAWQIVKSVKGALEPENKGAAVAVVDDHGELLAFIRTDGCKLPSGMNAINKAFTAAREQVTSKLIGEASKNVPFPMTNFGDLRYTAWGGGVPIIVSGEVLGAIGISGLPEAEDMRLAEDAVKLFVSQV